MVNFRYDVNSKTMICQEVVYSVRHSIVYTTQEAAAISLIQKDFDSNFRYDDQVPLESRFPPKFVFDSMKSYKVKIGLWIDLCNTSRFYHRKEVEELGAKYVKLQCRGHGETPSTEQACVLVVLLYFSYTYLFQKRPIL